METYHVPVMLDESIELLDIRPGGTYVDVTFGGGGHSRGILERLSDGGRLFAFDQDRDARRNLPDDPRLVFVESNFRFMRGWLRCHGVERVDGILADLGCGTGELTLMLTQAGYDMIGIDQSEEMLCVVRDKAEQLGLSGKLLLLQQDLLKLDLYGTIRGAVSTFDTFNHIPDLDTAIANAAFFMEEGGVFLFDMNTPYKHQKVLGENVFTFEEEDAACVWRNHYHPADRRVEITVDIDYRETGEHFHEQFYEYTYDLDTIRAALEKHGFVLEKVCDGESFGPLTEESERYFFCAVKQYTQLEEKENV